MFRRIVCATDFSEPANTATRYAASVARTYGSALDLVHAWDFATELSSEFAALGPESIAESRRLDEAKLSSVAAALATHGVKATGKLVDGSADRAIVAYGASSGADLIVTGTEGRTGVLHALLGSVAERILRTSDVAVLAVPRATQIAEGAAFAPKQILVPIDLSPSSAEVLRVAVAIAAKTGARVCAVHATSGHVYAGADGEVTGAADADIPKRATAWVGATLGANAGSVVLVVETGPPSDVIAKVASEQKPDLIVMATAGRTGIEHFMIGSVTERTLRTVGVPVLTFRRPPRL